MPESANGPRHESLGALGISELLRQQIRTGRYPDGRLPDEWVLTRELNISRTRLRAAITLLKDEGVLDRRRGHGTFVNDAPVSYEVGRGQGFGSTLAQQAIEIRHETLAAATWAMDPLTAGMFGVQPGVPMHVIERRTHMNGEVFALASYVVRGDLAPGLLAPELLEGELDVRDWLSLGCRELLASMDVTVEALTADEALSDSMACATGAALVRLHRRFATASQDLFAFGSSICRGDRFAYSTTVPLSPTTDPRS